MVSKYEVLAKELFAQIQTMHKSKHRKNLAEDGMNGESFVLYFLSTKAKEVLPSEISEEMHVSTARVATALNGLQDKGLITREIDASDRRRILVKLTQGGRDKANELTEKHLGHFTEVLEKLGEADASEYVRITGRIAAVLGEMC